MRYRYLLILLFTLLYRPAMSTVFVVTSNADSGPGTLREALSKAAANGNAEKDYINFNLPDVSEAGRTIAIKIDFPNITSDVVIDATTQPGAPLSINGAKVIIKGENEKALLVYCFVVNDVADFEMYGLIVKNLYVADTPAFGAYGGIVVSVQGKVDHMVIGAPGKGNVIYNVQTAIEGLDKDNNLGLPPSKVEQAEIKNNLIGIAEDGIKIGAYKQSNIYLPYVYNTVIGGDTKAEGNTIFDLLSITPARENEDLAEDVHIKIRNNVFSANTLQQRTDDPNLDIDRNDQALIMGVQPLLKYTKNTNVEVTDNVFGYTLFISGFTNLTCTIQRNFFGTSTDKKSYLPVGGEAISLYYTSGKTLIGGPDNSNGNVFTNCVQDKRAIDFGEGTVNAFDANLGVGPVSNFVELSHNSFYCNIGSPYLMGYFPVKQPIRVTVDNLTATKVNGTTTAPNARVELFYTDKECTQCQPKTFLATTNADANGNWSYSNALLPGYGVMAAATLNNNSSEFTDTRIYIENNPTYIQPECDKGGSVLNVFSTINTKKLTWLNEAGQPVGDKIDLINVPAGKYRLKAEQYGCIIYSVYVVLEDDSPYLDDANKVVIQPACGNPGAITGLYTSYAVKFKWVDAQGNQVSDQRDVVNLPEGAYTLYYTGIRGCEKVYGPVVLKKTIGPTVDDSKPAIVNTNCGQTIGSIKNVTVSGGTGTRHFIWKNELQQEVAYTQDLTGQPAGKYTLQVTDGSQCGSVFSKAIEILEVNGITLTESLTPTTPATCGKATGAITGIKVTGATKYEWRDANDNLKGSSLDLTNIPAGAYQLTASNAFCQKQSNVYQVLEPPGTVFPSNYIVNHIGACYGAANGGLQVNLDVLIKAVRWVNAAGVDVGDHYGVTNLPAGSYKLYLTDQNGCESYYNTYQVSSLPEFTVADNGLTANENCGLKNGSISSVTITGGLPPYTYKWFNADGLQIGVTNSITNLAEGQYVLNVTDSRCGNIDIKYTIQNITQDVAAPSLSDIQVCTPGDALVTVNNAGTNTFYRLYDQGDSAAPLAEQAGGRFKVSATANRSFFVSQLNGICESPKTEVKVSVGLSLVSIANTFSPNGDGSNDYWKINSIESYPAAVVQVFNRNGLKLFESKGYVTPFNGSYNGKPLPTGTYYYIINLNKNCSLLSGSLTILR